MPTSLLSFWTVFWFLSNLALLVCELAPPSNGSIHFVFTGAPQSYKIPANTKFIRVDACGSSGGSIFTGTAVENSGNYGGLGGYVSSVIAVDPLSTLWIYVGGGKNFSYNGGGLGYMSQKVCGQWRR